MEIRIHRTDCSLRQGAHPAWQGAGGTEFARNGSRTCLLRWRKHIFLSNTFFSKIVVLDLQTVFFDGKMVFVRFLAEIRLRTPIKNKFSSHFVQIPYHLHPARQGAHLALSNSLEKVFNLFCCLVYADFRYIWVYYFVFMLILFISVNCLCFRNFDFLLNS